MPQNTENESKKAASIKTAFDVTCACSASIRHLSYPNDATCHLLRGPTDMLVRFGEMGEILPLC